MTPRGKRVCRRVGIMHYTRDGVRTGRVSESVLILSPLESITRVYLIYPETNRHHLGYNSTRGGGRKVLPEMNRRKI